MPAILVTTNHRVTPIRRHSNRCSALPFTDGTDSGGQQSLAALGGEVPHLPRTPFPPPSGKDRAVAVIGVALEVSSALHRLVNLGREKH